MPMDMKRALVAGVVVAGIGVAFGVGVAVGADGPERPGRPFAAERPGTGRVLLSNADVTVTESCDDLLAAYVDRGVERVTPWGWDYGDVYADTSGGATEDSGDSAPTEERGSAAAPVPSTTRAGSSETGTNVQEEGVDEPDVVKTDGQLLVRVDDDLLTAYSLTGDEPELTDTLDLADVQDAEILLVGDDVVVIGRSEDVSEQKWSYSGPPSRSRVLVVDVSDPTSMEVTSTKEYDAALVTARLHGSVVRVVVSAGLPELDFVSPGFWRDEESAFEKNQEIVRDSTIEDWLPTVATDGGDPEPLMECGDVAIPEDEDGGLGTLAVVGFDPAFADSWDTAAVLSASQTVYASADRLVLATNGFLSGPAWWGGDVIECFDVCPDMSRAFNGGGTTHLYSFALSGTDAHFVAAGEVDGIVADRWSMDEADGVLRVAVGPSAETGPFNSVVTLRETGEDIVEVGRVDQLGPGEEIKSVRWFDTLAIVVTFRQVDPLYAVDLTDPESPQLLGELKIPGFSDYLHPLGAWRMIGVGAAADESTGQVRGAQVALFDVHDVTNPRQLGVVEYGYGTQALAGTDPRQFTWLPDRRTALTVVSDVSTGSVGSVSVIEVEDGGLTQRSVEVEYGDDVARVRLVPLADGRVVLVTGNDISFFDI
ncbi:beta-propeller domain-containing protein [Nocardioides bigeumensis]|uniref:beta-propeller domain-containing protein n=1 Tax=Nocardioides bigeumensis TaxID=433657 RepID=UPI0031D56B4C